MFILLYTYDCEMTVVKVFQNEPNKNDLFNAICYENADKEMIKFFKETVQELLNEVKENGYYEPNQTMNVSLDDNEGYYYLMKVE